MPHTKSKAQTRRRGSVVPNRKETRRVATGRMQRSVARGGLRELPLRGSNTARAKQRSHAEQDYAGDVARPFEIARGKRLRAADAESRYGRSVSMNETLNRKARNERRRPTKVAASTGQPRSRLGRTPPSRIQR